MTLQSSGPISMGDILTEKGITPVANGSYSLQTLSTTNINQNSPSKPDGAQPYSLSKFYGYNHNAVGGATTTTTTTSTTTTAAPTTTTTTTSTTTTAAPTTTTTTTTTTTHPPVFAISLLEGYTSCGSTFLQQYYTNFASFGIGASIYLDSNGTSLADDGDYGDGTNVYTMVAGIVNSIRPCGP